MPEKIIGYDEATDLIASAVDIGVCVAIGKSNMSKFMRFLAMLPWAGNAAILMGRFVDKYNKRQEKAKEDPSEETEES